MLSDPLFTSSGGFCGTYIQRMMGYFGWLAQCIIRMPICLFYLFLIILKAARHGGEKKREEQLDELLNF